MVQPFGRQPVMLDFFPTKNYLTSSYSIFCNSLTKIVLPSDLFFLSSHYFSSTYNYEYLLLLMLLFLGLSLSWPLHLPLFTTQQCMLHNIFIYPSTVYASKLSPILVVKIPKQSFPVNDFNQSVCLRVHFTHCINLSVKCLAYWTSSSVFFYFVCQKLLQCGVSFFFVWLLLFHHHNPTIMSASDFSSAISSLCSIMELLTISNDVSSLITLVFF